jgi:hypothetical protein
MLTLLLRIEVAFPSVPKVVEASPVVLIYVAPMTLVWPSTVSPAFRLVAPVTSRPSRILSVPSVEL